MMTEMKLEETIDWAKRMCENENLNRVHRDILWQCWTMMTVSEGKDFDTYLMSRQVGYNHTRKIMAMTLPAIA